MLNRSPDREDGVGFGAQLPDLVAEWCVFSVDSVRPAGWAKNLSRSEIIRRAEQRRQGARIRPRV